MSLTKDEIVKNGENAKYTLTSNGEGYAVEGKAMEESKKEKEEE